jgi:hypothetical protein
LSLQIIVFNQSPFFSDVFATEVCVRGEISVSLENNFTYFPQVCKLCIASISVTQRRQKSPNSVQKVPKTAFISELIRFQKIGIVLTVLLNKNCGQIIGQFLDFKISLKRQKFAQSGHTCLVKFSMAIIAIFDAIILFDF